MPTADEQQVFAALDRGRSGMSEDPAAQEMRFNRQASAARSSGNLSFATQRPRDPMFYWEQNNLPYRVDTEQGLRDVRAYCNTPEAPVWMGDYSFKPIGEIVAGDEVIGWEYHTAAGGGQRKKLVKTKVLATKRRTAPMVVKITMESGRVIRCTPDHQWANPYFSPGHVNGKKSWRQSEYREAEVGRSLVSIIEPTEPLADEKLRLTAAWLGGVYDGEGTGEAIAQDADYNPAVCDRIKSSLDLLGIAWTQNKNCVYIRTQGGFNKNTSRQQFVDFLNWTDPVRRVTNAIDTKLLRQPRGGLDEVVSIEEEGPGEVVSMQTETGNYTAWGYASKNCRVLYWSHPVIASAIDIYSKYPLSGLEITCKDSSLQEFYSDLFLNDLNYEEFLVDVLRSYWIFGEAWPFGSFNEQLGVWEDDELIHPDDVRVTRTPFSKEPRLEMKLPQSLRNLIEKREPAWEYDALMRSYPELLHYQGENAYMPVSNTLLKQLAFRGDLFHPRGIPILLRGLRAVHQEEMLNAAQDAIADRLYTPLILVRLGATAQELGTSTAWVPTQADIQEFEQSLDAALAADFRVLSHHFGVRIDQVFGRESMPRFDNDYERLTERQLQVFGMSKAMLSGSTGGQQTYAAEALNRDLVSQLLTSAQRMIKRFFRERAKVVAEAQKHYDYEVRGGKRYPIMEEVLEVDPSTGEKRIIQQPKLLIPELKIKTMDLKREEEMRQFIEHAVGAGVPISQRSRFTNVPIDLEEERDAVSQEKVENAIAEQDTRRRTYEALRDRRLPIPDDLIADFEPKSHEDATGHDGDQAATTEADQEEPIPSLDGQGVNPALAPVDEEEGGEGEGAKVLPLPRNQTRPEESDEMRNGMPRDALIRQAVVQEDGSTAMVEVVDDDGRPVYSVLAHGPLHVGSRRFAQINPDEPLPDPVAPPATA